MDDESIMMDQTSENVNSKGPGEILHIINDICCCMPRRLGGGFVL